MQLLGFHERSSLQGSEFRLGGSSVNEDRRPIFQTKSPPGGGIQRAFGKLIRAFRCLRGVRHVENFYWPQKFHRKQKKASRLLNPRNSKDGNDFFWRDYFPLEPSTPDRVLWRGWEELRLDIFQRLEALIDSAGIDGIDEANALLRRFKGKSEAVTAAIDEFMLDFKTLVFVVETGEAGLQKSLRELTRIRLSTLRQLVNVTA